MYINVFRFGVHIALHCKQLTKLTISSRVPSRGSRFRSYSAVQYSIYLLTFLFRFIHTWHTWLTWHTGHTWHTKHTKYTRRAERGHGACLWPCEVYEITCSFSQTQTKQDGSRFMRMRSRMKTLRSTYSIIELNSWIKQNKIRWRTKYEFEIGFEFFFFFLKNLASYRIV